MAQTRPSKLCPALFGLGAVIAVSGCFEVPSADAEGSTTGAPSATSGSTSEESNSGATSGTSASTATSAATTGTSAATENTTADTESSGTEGTDTGGLPDGICGDGEINAGESCDDAGASTDCTADCYLVGERLWSIEYSVDAAELVAVDLAVTPDRIHVVGRVVPNEAPTWAGWSWILDNEGEPVDESTWTSPYGGELTGVIAIGDEYVTAGSFEYSARVARGQGDSENWAWTLDSPSEAFDVARVDDELWVSGWAPSGRWLRRFDLMGNFVSQIPHGLGGSGSGTRMAAAAGVVVVEDNPGICRVDAAGASYWCLVPADGLGASTNVAVAPDGSILVAGRTGDDPYEAFIERYDPTSALMWSIPIGSGWSQGLAVDEAGNVLVGGRDTEAGLARATLLNLDGEVQWEISEEDAYELFAVAVGEAGRLTVVGPSAADEDAVFVGRYAF